MERWNRGSTVLDELTEDECWEHLGRLPVGRVAWQGEDGLTVVPVNYAVADRRIIVRTAAYTALGRERDGFPVAFQADLVDVEGRAGWSVLVRGQCRHEQWPLPTPDPEVWAPGTRVLQLRIEPHSISGRRLRHH
jgi:hypothetical protein